jgi:C1A family cysteine protease
MPIDLTPTTHKSEKHRAFGEFIAMHGKSFQSKEEANDRFKIFSENLDSIEAHNARSDSGYEKGLNAFGDMTHDEIAARVFNSKLRVPSRSSEHKLEMKHKNISTSTLPEYISWYDEKKYSNKNVD